MHREKPSIRFATCATAVDHSRQDWEVGGIGLVLTHWPRWSTLATQAPVHLRGLVLRFCRVRCGFHRCGVARGAWLSGRLREWSGASVRAYWGARKKFHNGCGCGQVRHFKSSPIVANCWSFGEPVCPTHPGLGRRTSCERKANLHI